MDQERIYRFVAGEMTPAERQDFKQEMETNLGLREEVHHQQQLHTLLNQERQDFRQMVGDVIASRQKRQRTPVWAIAAGLALLLVSALAYIGLSEADSAQELAQAYLEPYPDIITSRADTASAIDLSAYNRREYERAIAVLEPAYEREPTVLTGLYLAVSYLHTDRVGPALELLQALEPVGSLKTDVLWYTALAQVQSDEAGAAQYLLKELASQPGPYAAKAQSLLDAL